MNRHKRKILLSAVLVIILSVGNKTYTHPHVFITYWTDVEFLENKLSSVRVNWLFDEMFSSMIIMQHDKNKNGNLEPDEVQSVKKGAFDNLRHFNYFANLNINGANRKVSQVSQFNAAIQANRIIYSFSVNINVPLKNTKQTLTVKYTDPSIYVAFSPRNTSVVIKNQNDIKTEIKANDIEQKVLFWK